MIEIVEQIKNELDTHPPFVEETQPAPSRLRRAATRVNAIRRGVVTSIKRPGRFVRSRLDEVVINGLTLTGGVASVAVPAFLAFAGVSAYGAHYRQAGLFSWFALLCAGVSFASLYAAFWLTRQQAQRNLPSIHANDLI